MTPDTRRCRDCGESKPMPRKYKDGRVRYGRNDVCDECFENRGRLLGALRAGKITLEEFQSVQRSMRSGRGSAKKKIDKLLEPTHDGKEEK
jgi:hypothetical protein